MSFELSLPFCFNKDLKYSDASAVQLTKRKIHNGSLSKQTSNG